jgi:molybdopterin molybdotransferase
MSQSGRCAPLNPERTESIELEAALALVSSHTHELPSTRIPLEKARGRVLRADVVADRDSPPFDSAAMDGYAVRGLPDAEGFRCIGESSAGDASVIELQPGECVRIATGATVPAAADRVVMQEHVTVIGNRVRVSEESPATFIRRRGENCRSGAVVVPSRRVLTPIDLAAIATCGVAHPEVTRAARVVHLATGDELVPPEASPTGAQIRDSNSILVRAFLESIGATLVHQARVGDDLDAARLLVAGVPQWDLLLISGGASVGRRDFAKPLLRDSGFELLFEKLNLRPGKPLVFAKRDRQIAFAIPGNPVSHWVLLELIVSAAIRKLHGDSRSALLRSGRLENDFNFRPDPRRTFWPCVARWTAGGYQLAPLPFVSSGDVTGLSGANALLPISPGEKFISASRPIEFLLCDHGF